MLQSAPLVPGKMQLTVPLTWLLFFTQLPRKGTCSDQKIFNQSHAHILRHLAMPDNYRLAVLMGEKSLKRHTSRPR